MKINDIIIENRTRRHLGDIQQLANSISQIGLLHPVVVTSDNKLVAGYRRIMAFKLLDRDDIPVNIISNLDDALLQLKAEQHENTCRLDFTPSEAVSIGEVIEPLEREAASNRQQATQGNKQSGVEKFSEPDKGRALDKVANAVGMSRPTYNKAKKVINFTQENPEYQYIVEEMDETGKVDRAAKEMNRVIKEKKRQEIKIEIPVDSPIWHGDFREVGQKIPDNSVDLIFTDPPYNENAIELYRDLGIFAQRVLKPGGLCLAYSGQIHLPQVINALSENLEYVWCFAIWHNAAQTRIFKINAKNSWKPIVMYCKPPYEIWWKSFVDSNLGKINKDDHEWQQPIENAIHFISALCPQNGMVIDPFCGSGTTLVAAKKLGLRYIGIEDHIEDVKIATDKITQSV